MATTKKGSPICRSKKVGPQPAGLLTPERSAIVKARVESSRTRSFRANPERGSINERVRKDLEETMATMRAKGRKPTPEIVAQCPVCEGDVVARQETIEADFMRTPMGQILPTRTVIACRRCKVLFDGVPPAISGRRK